MKIIYDPFVLRQFKDTFKGTNLSKIDKTELLNIINYKYDNKDYTFDDRNIKLLDTHMEFCKYLVFTNVNDNIKSQVLPITLDIYPFIRSGYSSRMVNELPVLSRWAEIPKMFPLPVAKYVVVILYSKEQLLKEYNSKEQTEPFYMDNDNEYGIVSIMGTIEPNADPLVPVTMMRNSLGMDEGGNGEKINKEIYLKSVEFWDKNIIIG